MPGFLRSSMKFQSTLPVWGATMRIFPPRPPIAISIHAPRVGSDRTSTVISLSRLLFQSTLPVWGATDTRFLCPCPRFYFNPRSPCGERPAQTHIFFTDRKEFQSTLPVWGATSRGISATRFLAISIHAPRVGSDPLDYIPDRAAGKFQSTLPVWGATPGPLSCWQRRAYFNPRSPCGERLDRADHVSGGQRISIHAPRVGSDDL